jgi:hypothetical protein
MKVRKYIKDIVEYVNLCRNPHVSVMVESPSLGVTTCYYNNKEKIVISNIIQKRIKNGNFYFIEEEPKMQEIILNPPKSKELIINDIINIDHIGFIENNGIKGYIDHIGGWFYMAISVQQCYGVCNKVWLSSKERNIKDCLKYILNDIQAAYKFENRKELFRWLSE